MIIIQHIETHWTKQSRGMPGAALRNAVPRALAVPLPADRPDPLIHKVECREQDGFAVHERVVAASGQDTYWSLSHVHDGDATQVLFAYRRSAHGQPPRPPQRHPLFTLRDGETGVLRINGRFASTGGQFYTQHVVNVARVSVPDANVFLRAPPTYSADRLADLF